MLDMVWFSSLRCLYQRRTGEKLESGAGQAGKAPAFLSGGQ
jgi:hypothetical protein